MITSDCAAFWRSVSFRKLVALHKRPIDQIEELLQKSSVMLMSSLCAVAVFCLPYQDPITSLLSTIALGFFITISALMAGIAITCLVIISVRVQRQMYQDHDRD